MSKKLMLCLVEVKTKIMENGEKIMIFHFLIGVKREKNENWWDEVFPFGQPFLFLPN